MHDSPDDPTLLKILAQVALCLPSVDVAPYAAELRSRLEQGALPEHAVDLVLAAACVKGDRAALQHLEKHHLKDLATVLYRRKIAAADVEEVLQQLRERLLLGQRPRLKEYAGRGPLRAFLRSAALRSAQNMRRGESPNQKQDLVNLGLELAAPNDVELLFFERRYGQTIQEALQAGLQTLDARERTVLRLHLLDGLSLSQIGTLYKVNKSSVSRWIADARTHLLTRAKEHLAQTIPPADLASLIRGVADRLNLSLTRLLQGSEPG